jgi:hypothetical protein
MVQVLLEQEKSVQEGKHAGDQNETSGEGETAGASDGKEGEEEEGFFCDYGECDYSAEVYDYDDFTDTRATPLWDGVTQLLALRAGVTPRSNGGGSFIGVYHLPQQQAVAIKISSFQPGGGFYAPRLGRDAKDPVAKQQRLFTGFAKAFETAESFALRRGLKRVLLDLSGASGWDGGDDEGQSAYSAALFSLKYLQPGWRDSEANLCDVAAITLFSNFSRSLIAVANQVEAELLLIAAELKAASGGELKAAGRAIARAGAAAAQLVTQTNGKRLPRRRICVVIFIVLFIY